MSKFSESTAKNNILSGPRGHLSAWANTNGMLLISVIIKYTSVHEGLSETSCEENMYIAHTKGHIYRGFIPRRLTHN
jgi:hypothetical protein